MTESRVFTLSVLLLAAIAVVCAASHQWLGVVGSLLGAQNAVSARWFLLKWKPSATIE